MGEVNNKTKVIVAMSGGVDSSAAAALLKRAGFDVVGIHMKFWAEDAKSGNRCCTPESEKRARQVSKKLGIPFYVFNFGKDFKKKIVDYFLEIEKQGQTPNPCVVCNKEIKFGLLLEKALKLDADYIATGHYARLRRVGAEWKLLKGKDKNKDQSYFLWQLSQKQLKHILFPVGGYTKDEVRKLAKKFNLPTAKTQESQEVCFINTRINDFLKRHLKIKPGNIIDTKALYAAKAASSPSRTESSRIGRKTRALNKLSARPSTKIKDFSALVLGKHQGLWFYTIGQRKGIGIASGKPFYVLGKDSKKNVLIVTQNEKDLLREELTAKNINWISSKTPRLPLKVLAKIRYRSPSVPAIVRHRNDKTYIVKFEKPQRAITPGQSVVFYRGEELLGGGIIISCDKARASPEVA